MSIKKARKIGFKPSVDIVSGIKRTLEWYINSKKFKMYNAFTEKI